MKKIKKILIILIILILIAIIGALVYYNYQGQKPRKEVKIVKYINGYGYELKENETKLYKDTFEKLDKELSNKTINESNYAKLVAQLFIIDFYTLNNKLSKNDIGGLEFIKESMKDNFIEEARSGFYKYVELDSEKRNQELPEVSVINDVNVENTSFTYTDKTVDENAYKVTISWDYKKDLGYEKEAKMIIVKDNKKLYVVEMD